MRSLLLLAALLAAAPLNARVAVIDDTGQTVELPQPARRVISLSPHLTEQLFAIGAGELIVGASEHSDHPPAARSIPRVARSSSVDLERVSALRPDLIVLWGSGFSPAIADALRRLGVAVFVSEPQRLADISASMQRLATLTGESASQHAQRAVAEFNAQIEALQRRYSSRTPVRVFYQVWEAPLMTLSGRHVVSEAIRLCGGVNVFADLAPIAPQVSPEAVVAADPELIVTAEPGGKPSAALSIWDRFPRLSAVKYAQLATLNADRIHRHGPRMPQEVEALCEAIDSARRQR